MQISNFYCLLYDLQKQLILFQRKPVIINFRNSSETIVVHADGCSWMNTINRDNTEHNIIKVCELKLILLF